MHVPKEMTDMSMKNMVIKQIKQIMKQKKFSRFILGCIVEPQNFRVSSEFQFP